MDIIPGVGPLEWALGLLVLVVNAVGDSGTPELTHVDTLGLAMAVSGAIVACAPSKE